MNKMFKAKLNDETHPHNLTRKKLLPENGVKSFIIKVYSG